MGKGKFTIIDVRGTIRPFLGFASGQLQREMGPDVDVQGAMENMLEIRFGKLDFAMNTGENSIDGTFEMNLTNLDKFYEGYLVLLPAIQKQSNQQLAREAGEFGPLLAALMEINTEQGAAAIKAAIESDMKINGEAKFQLGPKDEDVEFTADGNMSTSDLKSYYEKAKAAGLPVEQKSLLAISTFTWKTKPS